MERNSRFITNLAAITASDKIPPSSGLRARYAARRLVSGFMQELAKPHTVLAPDYLPVMTIDEYLAAFDAILQTEGIESVTLGGQSYGGLLAQAYLAYKPQAIERLILSSTGPASYGKGWLPIEYLIIGLVRILPERTVKNLLAGGLAKAITVPDAERAVWMDALDAELRPQLDEDWQESLDEVQRIVHDMPPDSQRWLYMLWQRIGERRGPRNKQSTALYKLRQLALRLSEHWDEYALFQSDPTVPATNNGTEQAILPWRLRSRTTRGFKSWAGLEAAFVLCGSALA